MRCAGRLVAAFPVVMTLGVRRGMRMMSASRRNRITGGANR
jgi:hypothetical protein